MSIDTVNGVNKVKEFVLNNAPEGFACDGTKFSILCEKEPIVGTYTVKAKALYIIYKRHSSGEQSEQPGGSGIALANGDQVAKLYPENITQPWFEFTETNRRRLNNKKKPFWINGDTTIQHYGEHEYINYSLTSVKKSEEDTVKAFRKKYNVVEPTIYEGEQLAIEL